MSRPGTDPDGVVLWTRLAPEPLAPTDSAGCRPRAPGRLAGRHRPAIHKVVRAGLPGHPELAHSVHIEVSGLLPGATTGTASAPATSPALSRRPAPPRARAAPGRQVGLASCQSSLGPYAAYRTMPEKDLDLVVHVGDYIYERSSDETLATSGSTTPVQASRDLRAAHAAFPFVVTFDDHEVENNWAADVSRTDGEASNERQRFLAAGERLSGLLRAPPAAAAQRPAGPDLRLHRRLDYGTLATFHVLDTRQYRSDQLTDAFPEGRRTPGQRPLADLPR